MTELFSVVFLMVKDDIIQPVFCIIIFWDYVEADIVCWKNVK